MKNLTSKLLVLACIILAYMWYSEYSKNQQYNKEPQNLIKASEAMKMSILYDSYQYKFINEGLETNFQTSEKDYTQFSYSLSDLKGFISKTEKFAKEKDYENLGIRFHLGAIKEKGVPKTTLYYRAIGSPIESNLKPPIKFERLDTIGSILGDKTHCGGNPPKLSSGGGN